MRYLAILRDSLLEALDRKSLYVMLVLSGVFILILAGISYSPLDPAGAVRELVESFDRIVVVGPGRVEQRTYPATFRVDDIRELGAGEGKFEGGWAFTLTVEPVKEFHRLVRHWDAARREPGRKPEDPVPILDAEAPEEMEIRFLRQKYAERMIPRREIVRREASEGRRVYDVRIRPSRRETLDGAFQMHVLFGAYSFKLPTSVAMTVFGLEQFLSEYLAGLVGILIALVFTAGSIPSMLQKGGVDVLLSKPVRRPVLLAYKYLGGMTYATLTGLVFVGGSWLVLSARSGIWNWGYLASLGTLILFFAVLYSIGTLAAVLTRSAIAAIVLPVAAWAGGSFVNMLKNLVGTPFAGWNPPSWVAPGLETLSWFLPRSGDINRMNSWFMLRGSFGADVEALAGQAPLPEIAWGMVLLSSGLLIGTLLSLSCWIFSRRDY